MILNESGEFLEVVEELKILGVVVSSNMKWHSNTKYICGKGYADAEEPEKTWD